jgi:hypothetical protein
VRYINSVLLGIVLLLGSAIAQNEVEQNSRGAVLTSIKTVDCPRRAGASDVCRISVKWLKQLENEEQQMKSEGAIQLEYGDVVIWRHDKDFTLSKFVQVDCTSGTANNGTDPQPFENDFSSDKMSEKKAAAVNAIATEGSCFKHVVSLSDGTQIDPHIIIGGAGARHKPHRTKPGAAGSHTATKPK